MIHGSIGDTKPQIASDISETDPNYRLWGKVQFIVLVTRERLRIDVIFVGDNTETLKLLKTFLVRKICRNIIWKNYCQ